MSAIINDVILRTRKSLKGLLKFWFLMVNSFIFSDNQNFIDMKNMKFLLTAISFIAFGAAQAQVEKTTSTTTTTTTSLPDWGVAGSENARYYYIPDMESYYDIGSKTFVYMDANGQWAKSTEVPAAYKDVDLYDSYKVVLNDDTDPFANYDKLKVKYAKGYKGDPQKSVKIKKRKDGTVKIKEKN
jgi:hypothetical protein